MKKTAVFLFIFFLSVGMVLADFPGFKFVAPLESVSGPVDGDWTLTVMATSSQTIGLIVDDYSEIEEKHGGPLTPDALAALPAGTILKIRANFSEAGLYASEVEVFKDERDFELRGELDSVDCTLGILSIFGHVINLDTETEISNADGELLSCEDLEAGQFAEVKGKIYDSEFWATEIKIGVPGEEHLLMEFDAVVLEMVDSEWLVEIRGGKEKTPVPVLVVLDQNTQVEGIVEVGTEVEVIGVLTPELAVLAKSITAEDADADDEEGEQEGPEKEMEVYWAPGEIKAAPQGSRTVKLMLKYGVAPEDIVIPLTTDLSPELEIEVASEVIMPQGERIVDVQIVFLTQEGEGTITATLPEGDSDDLEIELKAKKNKNGGDDEEEEDDEDEEDEED